MTPLPLLLTIAIGVALPAARQSQPRPGVIRTEFRVFHGATEVTSDLRLRIRPSGSTETGRVLDSPPFTIDLPAGIYDVQAVRRRAGEVVNVRWAERLHVMPYPDEGGRHLEVINFADGYGALQLRWPEGQAPPNPAGVAVSVTRRGETRPTPARVVHGLGYGLLVLQAGTYDVHVARPGHEPVALPQVEVPAERTRMKVIR